MKNIYVIDALNYLFRSYYAIRGMSNKEGLSTNALFGFIRSVEKLRKDFSPDHIVVVFDGPENKHSRLSIHEHYKAHRVEMPEDLGYQIAFTKEYCEAAGISMVEIAGFEADDAMGAIAKWGETQGYTVYLCSSDKDLCQLVSDKIFILQTHKENLKIDRAKVIEKYGVTPEQFVDYLAITGDASDNIPGIAGFGPKTATELLQKHGSLKKILDHPEILEKKARIEKVQQEKKNALMSQELATIQTHLNIPKDLSFYSLAKVDKEALLALYERMNFKSLIKELSIVDSEEEVKKKTVHYSTVDDIKSLQALIAHLEKAPFVSLDTEASSLQKMTADLVGIGFATNEGAAWYVPMNGRLGKEALKHLKPFLESYTHFIGHNIKYDMHILANQDIHLKGTVFDTMLASYLLNSNLNRHNLEDLVQEHLKHQMIPLSDLIGKKKKSEESHMSDVEIEKVSEYCCEDVDYTLRLKNYFFPLLEKRSLLPLFTKIEMPLLPILFQMERHGIYVDVKELQSLSKDFTHKIEELQKQIFQITKKEFNLNSPKQLSSVLFEDLGIRKAGKKTKSGQSTGAEVLEMLQDEHEVIPLILSYRSLEKLRSTYIDSLPLQIDTQTNRIHCSFNQSVTATGRLSCKDPNLQNIPVRSTEGRKIRHAFKPGKPHWSFLGLDYSQIELRLLAHLSEDPKLIEAFLHDGDIHRVTASQVFNTPLNQVSDDMRQRAKAVNFGILYGQQAFGLSKELGIDVREAQAFIDTYFTQYPKIKNYLDKCKDFAVKEGRARTLLGRERLLPDADSKNGMLKAAAMRLAVNTPIQGTQADIIKMAMIEIDKVLTKHKRESFMILQIHDELIFECPDKEIPSLKEEIKGIMEGIIKLKVPLKVDISVGKNWEDC